jgi:hypothetical protein
MKPQLFYLILPSISRPGRWDFTVFEANSFVLWDILSLAPHEQLLLQQAKGGGSP